MTDSSIARPLIVVSGALGSGKTSGLPLLLAHYGFTRPHVIINDVGHGLTELSAERLPAKTTLSSIDNGCVCCEKNGALLTRLAALVNEPTESFDAVLLEVSGLANPAAVTRSIAEHPKLSHHLQRPVLVHYIDAALPSEGGGSTQRRSTTTADMCVVSKVDLVAETSGRELIAQIRAENPLLEVFEQSIHNRQLRLSPAAVTTIATVPSAAPTADKPLSEVTQASAAHHRSQVLNLELPAGTSWLALTTWLIALLSTWGDRIARVKATVPQADCIVLVNGVQHFVHPPQAVPRAKGTPDTGTLVLIGADFDPALVRRSLRTFVGIEAGAPQATSPQGAPRSTHPQLLASTSPSPK